MATEMIRIADLKKNYGNKKILKGINLSVAAGEIYGFIGKNGVGKSTTIDCMLGLKKYDSGSILIDGMEFKQNSLKIKSMVGYVASEPCCYSSMKGREYLDFIASVYHVTPNDYQSRLQELTKRLSLSDFDLNKYTSEYSHGMKQKLCLIASLLYDPKLWVLDEPTVGLDIMTVEELKKIMIEKKNKGDTIFFTSHNIEFVHSVCDRVGVIVGGLIQKEHNLHQESLTSEDLLKEFMSLSEENL